MPRPISTIAKEITTHWRPVNYAAMPYLRAMQCLTSIDDNYGADDGRGIIIYFLNNAATWRGEEARRIKKELKAML